MARRSGCLSRPAKIARHGKRKERRFFCWPQTINSYSTAHVRWRPESRHKQMSTARRQFLGGMAAAALASPVWRARGSASPSTKQWPDNFMWGVATWRGNSCNRLYPLEPARQLRVAPGPRTWPLCVGPSVSNHSTEQCQPCGSSTCIHTATSSTNTHSRNTRPRKNSA